MIVKEIKAEYRNFKVYGDFLGCERVVDSVKVSLKVITQAEALHRELDVFKSIGSHPNLVNLLNGKFFGKYALAEYEPFTTMTPLRQLIETGEKTSENRIRSITKQLVSAVSHIHVRGFVHGNINPDNFL